MAIGDKNPNKKAVAEKNKQQRVLVLFNTGTRSHKNKKAYDRRSAKKAVRDMTA